MAVSVSAVGPASHHDRGRHQQLPEGRARQHAGADRQLGATQTSYTYEPFGETTTTGAASDNTYQYTGRENDGTGLYQYRARYYSPAMKRFTSEDPIGFAGGDVNLQGYVGNSPPNYVDPSGLSFVTEGIDAATPGFMDDAYDWATDQAAQSMEFYPDWGIDCSPGIACVTANGGGVLTSLADEEECPPDGTNPRDRRSWRRDCRRCSLQHHLPRCSASFPVRRAKAAHSAAGMHQGQARQPHANPDPSAVRPRRTPNEQAGSEDSPSAEDGLPAGPCLCRPSHARFQRADP